MSTLVCLAILLSALLVGGITLPKADAATAPVSGPAGAYMYKYVHKDVAFNDGSDKNYYMPSHDADVTLQEGDVYRLSFYYNVDDDTYFPGQHDNRLPVDFAIGGQFILQNAGKKGIWVSADSNWQYISYEFTISSDNGYKAMVGKKLGYFTISPQYYGGTETIYLADIRLCPVTDGAVGDNLLADICDKGTLENWGYCDNTDSYKIKSLGAVTSRSASCYDFSVEPYNASLFKRSDATYMYHLTRKENNGDTALYFTGTQSVTFRQGDIYRLSLQYKMNDGSKFLTGGNPYSPFDIGLFHSGGSTVKLIHDTVPANTTVPTVDTEWNEIAYDFTIGETGTEELVDKQLLKVAITTAYYGSTDEVYLAQISLCPVKDGVVGDSLIPTINSDPDLAAWSADWHGNSTIGRVKSYENNAFTVAVEEYDESLFKKPEPKRYMYKYDRKNTDGDSKALYTGCKSGVTFREGDVYRLSFLYRAKSDSLFPGQHENSLPVDFGIRNSSGSIWNILQSSEHTGVWMSVDEDWYRITYDFTISANEGNYGTLIGWDLNSFGMGPLWYGSEETIYLADIQLCPVVEGVAGDTVIPGICGNATLSSWYGCGSGTTYSNSCFDLTVLEYDEAMFKRPLLKTVGVQVRAGTTNDLRFGFTVPCQGVTRDETTYEGDWTTNGKITVDGVPYSIKEAGAVVQIASKVEGELTRENGVDAPAKKIYRLEKDKGLVTFTAVVIKIPDAHIGSNVQARSYIVYEKDGQSVTLYGETITRSYNQVKG